MPIDGNPLKTFFCMCIRFVDFILNDSFKDNKNASVFVK